MQLNAECTCDNFNVGDMFFSRTDMRGVILSGNTVFQRVSGYDWSDLINAPHKLIRHPGMPKAVFKLLWETIQKKEVMAAYVCNSTKSGESYWVFATIFPLQDGYLSVRLKPTGTLLKKIVPIYNEIAKAEHEQGLTPDQSADKLLDAVKALGFRTYTDFMTVALTSELQARTAKLGLPANKTLVDLNRILASTSELEDCAQRVQVSFKSTHQIPFNMRLQASRLEGSDGPISVISDNHRQMSAGLNQIVNAFSEASRDCAEAVCTSSLEVAMATVLSEMRSVFAKEPDDEMPNKGEILTLLDVFSARYASQSRNTLSSATHDMIKFRKQCRHMRRALSGLELTRIMCKIERYRIVGDSAGLDEIVSGLAIAQKNLEKSCDDIERLATVILGLSENLLQSNGTVAA